MKKWVWILILVIVLILIDIGLSFSPALYRNINRNKDMKKVVIVGHRGAAGYAPENTLAALRLGIEQTDWVEIDVHLTRDGQPVVIHDPTVDRTTDGKGKVRNLTLDQIKQLDAGSWFSEDFKGEKIPTLDEVMQLIGGKAILLIEIKDPQYYPFIGQKVANLIKKYNAYDWTVVQSFSDLPLKEVNAYDPKVELHKLFVFKFAFLPVIYDGKLRFKSLRYYKKFDVKSVNVYYKFVNPVLIRQAHKLGLKVFAWTVDDPKIAKRLINMGVDGIITNYPKSIIESLGIK